MFSGFFIIRIESKTAYIYISLAWNMFARDLTYCCSMVIIIDIEKLENLWWKLTLHLNMLRTDCSHQNFDHFQLIFFSSFTQCFIAFASFNFSSCFFSSDTLITRASFDWSRVLDSLSQKCVQHQHINNKSIENSIYFLGNISQSMQL